VLRWAGQNCGTPVSVHPQLFIVESYLKLYAQFIGAVSHKCNSHLFSTGGETATKDTGYTGTNNT